MYLIGLILLNFLPSGINVKNSCTYLVLNSLIICNAILKNLIKAIIATRRFVISK